MLLHQIICLLLITLTTGKLPDSVSISIKNHTGFLIEGNKYTLQCDIQNMAAENFTVNWYEGEKPLAKKTYSGLSKTPENRSPTLEIEPTFSGSDHQYRCETELELGSEKKIKKSSSPLNIEVKGCFAILEPPAVLVEYGKPALANCSSDILNIDLGWEAPLGAKDPEQGPTVTWSLNDMNLWEIKPICFYMNKKFRQCDFELPVTVYKLPDSVSISTANHNGPMMKDTEYDLQCDIQNMFSYNFTVMWYIKNILINQERVLVEKSKLKNPQNFTISSKFIPDRYETGVQFRCEVELNLGSENPQPPPSVTSASLNISVH